jgi:hypothetical protein
VSAVAAVVVQKGLAAARLHLAAQRAPLHAFAATGRAFWIEAAKAEDARIGLRVVQIEQKPHENGEAVFAAAEVDGVVGKIGHRVSLWQRPRPRLEVEPFCAYTVGVMPVAKALRVRS